MSIGQEIREDSASDSPEINDVVDSSSRSQTPSTCPSESDDQKSNDDAGLEKPITRPSNLNLRHRKKWKSAGLDTNNLSIAPSSVLSQTRKQKVLKIIKALHADPVDFNMLRMQAIQKGGLVSDALRREAWPKLLNVNVFDIGPKPSQKKMKSHHYYNQVVLDVNRSLKRFPPGMEDGERAVLQDQLVEVIMRIMVKHKDLHYYQGYHDICVTFLLVVGEDITFALIDKLSTNHLRDFMDKTMDRTSHMLNYLYPILGRANPALRLHMERAELGTIFCLPWLITWYGHVMGEFRLVVRLYDVFLACHPLMPIYLAAAVVLYREEEVLACECDMASLHCLLSRIPPDLPWERLITNAGDFFIQYPPGQLASDASTQYESSSISNYDQFMKTTHAQRPDSVLKQSALEASQSHRGGRHRLVTWSVVMVTLAVLAALIAVLYQYLLAEWV